MADNSGDLANCRILITNDDGINSPGLRVLEKIARTLTKDVWVVAPETEQSATSHSLTLRRPLRIRKLSRRRYSLDGTPTDCVLVAVHKIVEGHAPDLVLSGINLGSNLGEDVTYSGTIAAAMEGALLGIRSIALSQARGPDGKLNWSAAEHFAPEIISRLMSLLWPSEVLVNVNFPDRDPEDVVGIRPCRQGRREEGTTVIEGRDPGGRPYVWIGQFLADDTNDPNTDLEAILDGAISVTPLHLDLTHHKTLKVVEDLFG